MAVAYALSWRLWSGKHQESRTSIAANLNTSHDPGLWEADMLKFHLVKGANITSSSRRVKRKWHSREERKIDKEYDAVLVPSDGGCVSGSESDDSDWSIGWLEPHGPGFQSDDGTDNNFAVLVPCYAHNHDDPVDHLKKTVSSPVGNIPNSYTDDSKNYMEQWLLSLQNT